MQTFPVTEACRLSIGALVASTIFLAKQSTQIQRRCLPSRLVLTDKHIDQTGQLSNLGRALNTRRNPYLACT